MNQKNNLDDLKPGPETDRLVAEAIGLDVQDGPYCQPSCFNGWISWEGPHIVKLPEDFLDNPGIQSLENSPKPLGRSIHPFSTDLNDAFWAANKVFSTFNVQKTSGAGFGFCTIESWHGFKDYPNGQILAETPAMVICKALLLRENRMGFLATCKRILKIKDDSKE